MTAQEILSSLSSSLMDDERILNARERELLASLLQHVHSHSGPREHAVTEKIARAVGEVIAQRAYAVLGSNITRRLLDPSAEFDTSLLRAHSPHPPGPSPPGPGSVPIDPRPAPVDLPAGPRPAGPRPAKVDFSAGPRDEPAGPRPAGPRPAPADQPAGPRGVPRDMPMGPRPEQPPGPRGQAAEVRSGLNGSSVPQAVNLDSRSSPQSSVAVMEAPEILPAACVVLNEFLSPAELETLVNYTLAKESEFQVSEVISPDVGGGVDFEYRRSRVLHDLGPHREVVVSRVQAVLPRILEQLSHEPFAITRVEAQITASNDGDFFRWHTDNGEDEIAGREVTFVYFFHREPKQFQGGELRLYDSRWQNGTYRPQASYRTIVPQQNQAVLFLSSLAHEITPIDCPSGTFADSRFTLNGWLHR